MDLRYNTEINCKEVVDVDDDNVDDDEDDDDTEIQIKKVPSYQCRDFEPEFIYRRDVKYSVGWLDFETSPFDTHKPYMCCLRYNGDKNTKTFIGCDCGLQMLMSLHHNTIIYIHNAKYDINFLVRYFRSYKELSKGNRIINGKFKFGKYSCELVDTLQMINSPLSGFDDMFKLKNQDRTPLVKKLSHIIYTLSQTLQKKIIPIDEAIVLLKKIVIEKE